MSEYSSGGGVADQQEEPANARHEEAGHMIARLEVSLHSALAVRKKALGGLSDLARAFYSMITFDTALYSCIQ